MSHDPLSPSEALRTPIGTVLTAVSLLVFVYSLVIVGQLLFGVIVVLTLSAGPYLSYRTFAVLDSIADAAQRFAAVREREADDGDRFDRPVDRDGPESREREERATERER
ncbi:hypothetical protein C463_06810 [Halorubrum californiense DSM 19288]|uniref:Uncharacterized protein n=1 Tax=Halorubrum californiense DSM 19288 TaxID=1227465 RepID=M0EBH8_9EURY|nr:MULTISPECIES: hypothetical protein [Halorubrum]ELZ45110.1 hypothetical protein C463_06810 [Halorubrum californiense DSM 19288]TKX68915.1 hypothetical protein EXE40_11655 [Halorubrum sp. GN11GM_10-3_MGM]